MVPGHGTNLMAASEVIKPTSIEEAIAAGYDWIELYWKDIDGVRGTLAVGVDAFRSDTDLSFALDELRKRLKSGSMVGGGLRENSSRKFDPDESAWIVIAGFSAPELEAPTRKKRSRSETDGSSKKPEMYKAEP